MKKLVFSIEINASREKVWDILWSDQNYRKWTASFIPGSYYEGELQEGKNIRFLSPGEQWSFCRSRESDPMSEYAF